jgi:hypothetical protein
MLSEENPDVAAFSCSKLNSVKLGNAFLSLLPPFSAPNDNITPTITPHLQKNKIKNRDGEETGGLNYRDRRIRGLKP